MKKIISLTVYVLFTCLLMAQAPNGFKYQAILRNADGTVKASESVTLDINILKSSATGSSVYSETHNVTTNAYGLANLVVGDGTSSDNFDDIDWSSDEYYIKISVDGTEFGTSQLLSVPYALYAKRAEVAVNMLTITANITDATNVDSEDGAISVTVSGGTPPYSYSWLTPHENRETDNLYALTSSSLENLRWGFYDVCVTDNGGHSVLKRIKVGHGAPIVTIDSITPSCANEGTGAIDISVNGGTPPYSYRWSHNGRYSSTEDITNAGGYCSLQLTDANGNQGVLQNGRIVYVNIPYYKPSLDFVVTNVCSENDGAINVSVAADEPNQPFTFKWAGELYSYNIFNKQFTSNEQNIIDLETGYYTLTVTDNTGCQSGEFNDYVEREFGYVDIEAVITCNSIDITVYNYEGGLAYEWSDNSDFENIISTEEDLTNVDGNKSYYLRLTNEDGCISNTRNFYLSSSFDLDLEYQVTQACTNREGIEVGGIDITPNYEGTLSYKWYKDGEMSVISTEQDLTGIEDGYYQVEITNENGCKYKQGFRVYSKQIVQDFSYETIKPCGDESSGSIDITAISENPLTYEWATIPDFSTVFSTDEDIANMEIGRYFLRITDLEGCFSRHEINLEPFYVYVEPYVTHASSNTNTDGAIYIIVRTDGNFTFEWSTQESFSEIISTEENLANVGMGTYYLRITDTEGNMCQMVRQFTIQSIE